jgi:enoyl-CoA hydratase/carnithine racemase
MSHTGYAEIEYRVDEQILTITLSRPAALNAFTPHMFDELIDAFDRSDSDDDIRAVIVTGSGHAFCAGADISVGPSAFDPGVGDPVNDSDDNRDRGGRLALRIMRSLKPVIAAVNGAAVGIGVSMTLPMDIRLASKAAKFGFVFTRRGISPDACSTWFLPRVVGISQAQEWILSGRLFSADEALRSGLVRSVHEPAELLPQAQSLARELVKDTAAVSVALSRRLLWEMLAIPDPGIAHLVESRVLAERARAADAREGVSSFLEKRPAAFPMSVTKDMPDLDGWLRRYTTGEPIRSGSDAGGVERAGGAP